MTSNTGGYPSPPNMSVRPLAAIMLIVGLAAIYYGFTRPLDVLKSGAHETPDTFRFVLIGAVAVLVALPGLVFGGALRGRLERLQRHRWLPFVVVPLGMGIGLGSVFLGRPLYRQYLLSQGVVLESRMEKMERELQELVERTKAKDRAAMGKAVPPDRPRP